MKIIHVIPGFLPEYVAGTEIYCWSVCKYLQGQGIDTAVITPGYGQDKTTEYTYDGINVIRYAEPTVQTRLHIAGLALPAGLDNFKAVLRSASPDCLHFHGIYAGVGITLEHMAIAKKAGIPVIYTMHLPERICATQTLVYKDQAQCDGIIRPIRCAYCNMRHQGHGAVVAAAMTAASTLLSKTGIDAGYWNSSLGTGLSCVNRTGDIRKNLTRLAGICDKAVVIAQWFRKMLVANGFPEDQIIYVPPALPPVSTANTGTGSLTFTHPDSVRLIFAGRVGPLKGLKLLLEAMKGLPEDRFELSIYGKTENGGYEQECRSLSEGKANIHWRGLFRREDMTQIMRQHDMLCLPSAFSEMSPLVIQEAFAAGLPVLASEAYGNAEVIEDGHIGLLFAFKSAQSLRDQLLRLMADKTLLGTLKKNIKTPLDFDVIGEQYAGIYQSLIKNPKACVK